MISFIAESSSEINWVVQMAKITYLQLMITLFVLSSLSELKLKI
jgi:hypothetical protein